MSDIPQPVPRPGGAPGAEGGGSNSSVTRRALGGVVGSELIAIVVPVAVLAGLLTIAFPGFASPSTSRRSW